MGIIHLLDYPNVNQCRRLKFHAFPSRPQNVRIVRECSILFGVSKAGRLFTSVQNYASRGGYVFPDPDRPEFGMMLGAMVKLNVLDEDVVESYETMLRKQSDAERAQRHLRELTDILDQYGMKPTKTQIGHIEKVMESFGISSKTKRKSRRR